jgi:hypothetical protein
MKVYRRKDFLQLPAGVLFCKGKPWYWETPCIKGDTLENTTVGDFLECGFCWVDANDSGEAFDRLNLMLETGASFPMEEAYGRDGMYDEEDLFLVFEKADIAELMRVFAIAADVTPS